MTLPDTQKLALLFPGQGSQTVGMGRDLYDRFPSARAVFDEADEALGFSLSKLIFEGPDEDLRLTENTQPAILTVSVAAYRVLAEALAPLGMPPAFAAGHSLGEYSAHVAAGTFSFAEAVRTVKNRGRYMQEAVPAGEGAMAAILGLPAERINDICAEVGDEVSEVPGTDTTPSESHLERAIVARAIVSPANLNSPDQTVISGAKAAVERAAELCKAAGAKRTVMLPVSAPFHCALMQLAQDRLATDLEAVVVLDPAFPVMCNVDARLLTRRSDIRDCLIRQVTGSVRWVECIQGLIQQGATRFIEVGPGKVLSGLMRQIDRTQATSNVEDSASLEKTLAALTETSAT
ncbi:[acyl-carrier-protein] S-malonyltransferase [Granulicella pectinivorans]|uniref:Malonyl CoA-acyl carrier protein transacylase n=1 Tax=Granulicella pectinivorans TaxID=474950 RepID=A0A1I6LMN0_9BACT|nr:ACP S-malonyltransferase [Granulicella pectinivorans]SFS04669.1 [acyl-carrier-protein] S-malonyltransferase [Granulicella pectinivorans]